MFEDGGSEDEAIAALLHDAVEDAGGKDRLRAIRAPIGERVAAIVAGIPLDQDVYDAAVLSSIVPLSQWSVLNRSNSIDVPDVTDGAWKSNRPNMDIMLERGGSTRVIL